MFQGRLCVFGFAVAVLFWVFFASVLHAQNLESGRGSLVSSEQILFSPWSEHVLRVDGLPIRYRLFVPRTPDSGPKPAVIVLHDNGGSPEQAANRLDLFRDAIHRNTVLVFPEAPSRDWSERLRQDSVLVVFNHLIWIMRDVSNHVQVQSDQVHVLGLGEGGRVALDMACSDRTIHASHVSLGGRLRAQTATSCRRPGPVLMFWDMALESEVVTSAVEASDEAPRPYVGVSQAIAVMVSQNGCPLGSGVNSPSRVRDRDNLEGVVWENCRVPTRSAMLSDRSQEVTWAFWESLGLPAADPSRLVERQRFRPIVLPRRP